MYVLFWQFRQSDEDNSSLTTSVNSRPDATSTPINEVLQNEDIFVALKPVEIESQPKKSVTTAV